MDPAVQSLSTQTPLIIAMLVLLVCSAIASASETALLGLSRSKRAALRHSHPTTALAVDILLAKPRQLLLQVLLLNMVVNVGYFIATSILTLRAQSTSERIVISIASLFAIILIGEVFAKLAAVAFSTLTLKIVAPLHVVLRQPLRPIIAFLERFCILPGTRLLVPDPPPPPGVTPEEMSTLLAMGTNEGLIDESEQDLLAAIVMLSQRSVEDIMRPRVDFIWIDSEATYEQVLDACKKSPVSHFPVFENGLDGKPIGMTDAKQVLAGKPIRETLTPLLFVPEQATLDTLLSQFRSNAQTVALIVNEHGTVVGLVTLTDIADQLLTGTSSHNSVEAQEIILIGPAQWSVPGRLAVHDWSALFGGLGPTNSKASSPAKTIAGLIMHTLGRVPSTGDEINIGAATLKVLTMNDLVVETVEVTLNLDSDDSDEPQEGNR
ncbi:MAG: hemolysin family protein [Phycisphaerales bacterium]